ncbi:MAG: DUF2752 domain-containing protein [Firmicutes bacterium]|nr:DUF2752 domain-containing protein [Bacillota bacterium]MCM1400604.1 DUF2752 domain-containing protein [Bacteroides sp.]MCM1476315.1 DUF2752 domain-containing protein [Bacteroides sp.]
MARFLSRQTLVTAIIVVAVIALSAIVYWAYDPSKNFFPRCPVYMATGWQCPGCGSQRAIHALLNGDLAGAWHYNAMLLFFIPVIGVLLASELFRERFPRFNKLATSSAAVWIIVAILFLWGVLRNIL